MVRAFVMAVLVAFLAFPAYAQMKDMPTKCDMGHGPGRDSGRGSCQMCTMEGKEGMMGGMIGNCLHFAEKIGLTEEQIGKIKPLQRDMQKKQIRFQADLRIAKIELREIMEVKDFDLEKAAAQVKKIEDMKTAHHLEMLKYMKEFRAILTEEQFRKMQKMMPGMGDGHKPHQKMMKKK